MEQKKLAIIASRLKCPDSICVESEKWIEKYTSLGYEVHLICGKIDEPTELKKFIIPELDNHHPEIRGLKRILFTATLDKAGKKATNIMLSNLQSRIKKPLKRYLTSNKISIISVENLLCDASNLPLTNALNEIIDELGIPTISRYHDFYWDNDYFAKHNNLDKMLTEIPPNHGSIVHITNTRAAKDKLQELRNIHSTVIPNTFATNSIQGIDEYNKDFREKLGIRDDQILFLQPTLLKRRKSVEKSLRIVREINDITKKDNVLLITGPPVYSKGEYFEEIARKMKKLNVNVIFASDRLFLSRQHKKKTRSNSGPNDEQKRNDNNGSASEAQNEQDNKTYSIWDAYANADVVIYPTTTAAFGNPVIEAIAHKKPIIVNNYPNLRELTEKGFKLIVMDQKVTPEIISDTYEIIINPEKRKEMTEHNYEIFKTQYSTDILDDRLVPILNSFEEDTFMNRIKKIIPNRFKEMRMPRWRRTGSENNRGADGQNNAKTTDNPAEDRKNNNKEYPEKDKEGAQGQKNTENEEESYDLRNRKGSYKEPSKNSTKTLDPLLYSEEELKAPQETQKDKKEKTKGNTR
jgi:glycosyltransferase involved in cell wall biosynthesis